MNCAFHSHPCLDAAMRALRPNAQIKAGLNAIGASRQTHGLLPPKRKGLIDGLPKKGMVVVVHCGSSMLNFNIVDSSIFQKYFSFLRKGDGLTVFSLWQLH